VGDRLRPHLPQGQVGDLNTHVLKCADDRCPITEVLRRDFLRSSLARSCIGLVVGRRSRPSAPLCHRWPTTTCGQRSKARFPAECRATGAGAAHPLANRTAAALQSGLVKSFSYPSKPRSDRPRSPDRPLVAPKVAGSSPVGHPHENLREEQSMQPPLRRHRLWGDVNGR